MSGRFDYSDRYEELDAFGPFDPQFIMCEYEVGLRNACSNNDQMMLLSSHQGHLQAPESWDYAQSTRWWVPIYGSISRSSQPSHSFLRMTS